MLFGGNYHEKDQQQIQKTDETELDMFPSDCDSNAGIGVMMRPDSVQVSFRSYNGNPLHIFFNYRVVISHNSVKWSNVSIHH